VDAVAQRRHVLLDREILPLAERRLGQLHTKAGAAIHLRTLDEQPAAEQPALVEAANEPLDGVYLTGVGFGQGHHERVSFDARHAANARLAQTRAKIRFVSAEELLDRGV